MMPPINELISSVERDVHLWQIVMLKEIKIKQESKNNTKYGKYLLRNCVAQPSESYIYSRPDSSD